MLKLQSSIVTLFAHESELEIEELRQLEKITNLMIAKGKWEKEAAVFKDIVRTLFWDFSGV